MKVELGLLGIGNAGDKHWKEITLHRHLVTDSWMKHVWDFSHNNSIVLKDNVDSGDILRQGNDMLNVLFAKGVKEKMVSNGE